MPSPTEQPSDLSESSRPSVVMVGVFEQLLEEQDELVGHLERTFRAQTRDIKQAFWAELRETLLSHERAKTQEIYPAFEEYPSLRPLVDDTAHQTRVIESVVRNLSELPFDSPDWSSEFERLRDTVLGQITKEQTHVFPLAQQAMGPDRAQLLQLPYVSARRTHALAFSRKPNLPKAHP